MKDFKKNYTYKIHGQINVERAHEISAEIEKEVREKLKIETTVHVEPEK